MIRRDTAWFARLVASLLASGRAVRFRAEGDSMAPAIEDGDDVIVAPVADPAPGDILLCRSGDRLVVHRLIASEGSDGARRFILQGDAVPRPDPPVDRADVLGRVVGV
ncbi:MAG TPA: S24/S26 family peptidase, partial [Vicinamibacterales bacterium]|nr:S24/S26 family peptidase [Vicinamibacterales bacterium]